MISTLIRFCSLLMKSNFLSGCEFHPRRKPARNHFIYNDLPHFIMDSYEECRDPPRIHLLDKYVKFPFPVVFLFENSKIS